MDLECPTCGRTQDILVLENRVAICSCGCVFDGGYRILLPEISKGVPIMDLADWCKNDTQESINSPYDGSSIVVAWT